MAADVPEQILKRMPEDRREAFLEEKFAGKAAIYLPPVARFSRISALPQEANLSEAVVSAMDAIEENYPILKGALPCNYGIFDNSLLANLIKIFSRPALDRASGDVFGRIYEYFLNKFAMSGAQEGGEFFTPPSLVRMIVNIIEPDHGIVLDPACGSGGMFVQTSHFIEDVRHLDLLQQQVWFNGQEKSDTNTYDKTACNFLGAIHLAASVIWLN